MRLQDLPGLGPKRVEVLKNTGIQSPEDLLRYIPRSWQDRTQALRDLSLSQEGDDVVVLGKIVDARLYHGRSSRFQAVLEWEGGSIVLVFFHFLENWTRRLQVGKIFSAFGRLQSFQGQWQIVHPDLQSWKKESDYRGEVFPIYPLSEEMRSSRMEHRFFHKVMQKLFTNPAIRPWLREGVIPECVQKKMSFSGEWENLRKLHLPSTMQEVSEALTQLKMSELLPFALRLSERRARILQQGLAHRSAGNWRKQAQNSLAFTLTQGQEKCLETLVGGLHKEHQYMALLQGDVGSGKTILAILAALEVLESGEQVALMAPTDILARQHYNGMQELVRSSGASCVLLTGSAKNREEVLERIAKDDSLLVIGTHALFSEDVAFKKLGLAIVDEQHRFGVRQREALLAKAPQGQEADLIVMSATPIPRSLTMTLYGDLQAVVLSEKPPGRKDVKTRIVPEYKKKGMLDYLAKETNAGNQCYWIVPRVADRDDHLESVESLVRQLRSMPYNWRVDFVHGQMEEEERNQVLAAFATGKIDVLVATTVVEVGVNVPNANLMVIEHPERFGLAQLHQLRGRVGRGAEQAWCFLMLEEQSSSYERIEGFATTNDGFVIAELDLQQRGSGNLEGTEQSGAKVFRYFHLLEDVDMVQGAVEEADAFWRGEWCENGIQEVKKWIRQDTEFNGVH
jgi:ATP-dependent DNA helicase RecG